MRVSNRKKRRVVISIIILIILLILLVPVPLRFRDGGTVEYTAMIYTVTVYNHIWYEDDQYGRLVGVQIDIFGRTVFDNSRIDLHE